MGAERKKGPQVREPQQPLEAEKGEETALLRALPKPQLFSSVELILTSDPQTCKRIICVVFKALVVVVC